MPERHAPTRPEAPAGGPETFDRDLNVKGIVYTTAGLATLVVLSMLLMWWLGKGFGRREAARDPRPRPIPEAAERRLPPEPRLQGAPGSAFEERQGAPELELERMRAEEEAVLSTYGWVDPEGGVARIPIERAIEILGEQGLPEAVGATVEGTTGGADAP